MASGREERELEQIALPVGRVEVGRRRRAVQFGMNVFAAGEQETVDSVEGPHDVGRPQQR